MRNAFLMMLFLTGLIATPALGQSKPLQEHQKAVLAFDIRIDKLRDSDVAKALNIEEQIAAMATQGDNVDPTKLMRIVGAASAPKTVKEAKTLASGNMPMEFFVKMSFTDASELDRMIEQAESKGATSFKRDGKTYYRMPAEAGMPAGVVTHRIDDKTMETGTEAYVFHPDQPAVFGSGLKKAWQKVPDEAIRLALDLDGPKEIVKEAVEMAQQGADGMVSTYLGLIDNAKDIRLSIDLSGSNLLTIEATGVSESDAEELASGLDSLLGTVKMIGGMQVGQLKQLDADAGAALEEILKSLKAKSEGSEVSVMVPKPDGFAETLGNAMEKFGGAFGGAPGK